MNLTRVSEREAKNKQAILPDLRLPRYVYPCNTFQSKILNVLSGKMVAQIWGITLGFDESHRAIIINSCLTKRLPAQCYRLFCTLIALGGDTMSQRQIYQTMRPSQYCAQITDAGIEECMITYLYFISNNLFGKNFPIDFYKITPEGQIGLNLDLNLQEAYKLPKKKRSLIKRYSASVDIFGATDIYKSILEYLWIRRAGTGIMKCITDISKESSYTQEQVLIALHSEKLENIVELQQYKLVSQGGRIKLKKT